MYVSGWLVTQLAGGGMLLALTKQRMLDAAAKAFPEQTVNTAGADRAPRSSLRRAC
jgi:hypothetical protein